MQPVPRALLAALTLAWTLTASMPVAFAADDRPLDIVAAENFYGDIAEQLGGPDVKVISILSNPDQDPICSKPAPPPPGLWPVRHSSSIMVPIMTLGFSDCWRRPTHRQPA